MKLEGQWLDDFRTVRDFVEPEVPAFPMFHNAVIAGGWLRDMVGGTKPIDLDVFIDPKIARKIKADHGDRLDLHPDGVSEAPNVISVAVIHDLLDIQVQFIEVKAPIESVGAFDAYCNMMWASLTNDGLIAAGMYAEHDARSKIWRANTEAGEPFESLVRRAAEFKRRGYTIVWPV